MAIRKWLMMAMAAGVIVYLGGIALARPGAGGRVGGGMKMGGMKMGGGMGMGQRGGGGMGMGQGGGGGCGKGMRQPQQSQLSTQPTAWNSYPSLYSQPNYTQLQNQWQQMQAELQAARWQIAQLQAQLQAAQWQIGQSQQQQQLAQWQVARLQAAQRQAGQQAQLRAMR